MKYILLLILLSTSTNAMDENRSELYVYYCNFLDEKAKTDMAGLPKAAEGAVINGLNDTKRELQDWMNGKPMQSGGKMAQCKSKLENLIKYHGKRPNHEKFAQENENRLSIFMKLNSADKIDVGDGKNYNPFNGK